ncbi:hypothetical protein C8Q76DRAFT_429867 [Earliella scabrosa]|nr:hypothetical protein C8Q76DRAFT_429867 [Earliella scabrosa]
MQRSTQTPDVDDPDSESDISDVSDVSEYIGSLGRGRQSASPARATSARLRGIEARFIRTSISPDRIIRRRRKLRRYGFVSPDPCQVIDLSSDSEDPEDELNASVAGPPRKQARMIIARDRFPGLRSPEYSSSSGAICANVDVVQRSTSTETCTRPFACPLGPPIGRKVDTFSTNRCGQRPVWLRYALGELYNQFPNIRFVTKQRVRYLSHADQPDTWQIECRECKDLVVRHW